MDQNDGSALPPVFVIEATSILSRDRRHNYFLGFVLRFSEKTG